MQRNLALMDSNIMWELKLASCLAACFVHFFFHLKWCRIYILTPAQAEGFNVEMEIRCIGSWRIGEPTDSSSDSLVPWTAHLLLSLKGKIFPQSPPFPFFSLSLNENFEAVNFKESKLIWNSLGFYMRNNSVWGYQDVSSIYQIPHIQIS